MELDPSKTSLNEIASVGALLQIHAEALYSRAKTVKAKADLNKDMETFKEYKEGAFEKDLPKGQKVQKIILAQRIEKINQDLKEGEEYALKMIVEPHAEEADFVVAGF
ncbi:13545_t:CDS:1 [Gigaspora margarita]|uniref:13545_t:CDS:1 n=1 Tax=Gigaspora margarita TaxID=4874 RepID=A0ABM8W005_GIGMA|nr:13545_t:CDS:1 [Gigaspora margarita]